MLLTSRHIELLDEIYQTFLATGQFPVRKEFRDSHKHTDLKPLDDLEHNFNYIRTYNDQYQFPFEFFLASSLGIHEKRIAFRLAKALQPLYADYSDTISIPFERLIAIIALPSGSTRRGLKYLDQLSFVRYQASPTDEAVRLCEKIRTIESDQDLIPSYAIERWERDTGKRPPLGKGNMMDSLIGPAQTSPAKSEFQWDSLDLDWLSDEALRNIIGRDYEECRLSYFSSAYKCALIMTGACMEGVLLGALLKRTSVDATAKKIVESDLKALANSWKKSSITLQEVELSRLLQLATTLKMIKPSQAKLGAIVTEYRNYIHPGKEVRINEIQFDDPEAKHAIQVLRLIARDISQHFSGPCLPPNDIDATSPASAVTKRRRPTVIFIKE